MNSTKLVAIMAPFPTAALGDFIPALKSHGPVPPGENRSNIVHLVLARLTHGLRTDIITLDPAARVLIQRWEGPLARLWVVKRRAIHALRDGYLEERRLLHQALAQSCADVCHAHWTYEYGMAAVTQKAIPNVVTVHDHAGNVLRLADYRYIIHYLMTRFIFRKAQILTAVSPYVAGYIAKVAARRADVVPNPLRSMEWSSSSRPAPRDPSAPAIVSVVNWSKLKNVKTALRAFSALRETLPSATYMLIGPGLEADGPGWNWANRMGLANSVTFRGPLDYPATLQLMRDSTVMLHPSLEESFGCSVAEAMALHVPVIACREAQGTAWLLDDGQAGRLVSGRSPLEMAKAIVDTIGETDRTSRLLSAAFLRVRDICDVDSVLHGYDKVYEQAIVGFK